MAYDEKLAGRIREYLSQIPGLVIEEKKMFRGLTFMVNGKMCVSASGNELMLRFDPNIHMSSASKLASDPCLQMAESIKATATYIPIILKQISS